MKRVCIIGGQLQGLEATYLAKKAGYETVVIDKQPNVPASYLTDEFLNLNLIEEGNKVKGLLKSFDLVLPATEKYKTLAWLRETSAQWNYPLALDLEAYKISSSKISSNSLLAREGINIPKQWPDCSFPIIVKPSNLSGSEGVRKVDNQLELNEILQGSDESLVIEECLAGTSFSLEVIANKGNCVGLQVTELEFDSGYDCKRVIAGPNIGTLVEEELYHLGDNISKALSLSGIMDIEVIAINNKLKVLEIDARIPSQTPSAVLHSSGLNMVELLLDYWSYAKLPNYKNFMGEKKAVIYEHLSFNRDSLSILGEHCMVNSQNLEIYTNKFRANTIISNFEKSSSEWVATIIFEGKDEEEVWENRQKGIKELCETFNIKNFFDDGPDLR